MPYARITDPETSHEAAESVSNISETQERILNILKDGPLTDEHLNMIYKTQVGYTSESGIRSRRAELVERGLVRDSGMRQKLRSGRSAIVWEATKTLQPS